jgi:murein DD-endopeptidase MepM/ murein hydrolase activator NlpD
LGPLVGVARRLWWWRKGRPEGFAVHWPLAVAGAVFWGLLTVSVVLAVPSVQFDRSVYLVMVVVLAGAGTVGVFEQVIARSAAPTVGVITLTVASCLLATQLLAAYAFSPGGAVRLAFPLEGEWHVLNGGRSVFLNGHWHVTGQGYALDIVRRRGAAGAEVRAPADGEVVRAVEDSGHAAGTYAVLRVAPRVYVALAHFQQGSLRVAAGTRVRTGDVIGLVGSTGNSSEPHLHIQVQDEPEVGEGRTRPIDFGSGVLRRSAVVRG